MLKQEYLETYMPKPDADPHGGVEAFEKVENPYCDIPEIPDDIKKGYADEMA